MRDRFQQAAEGGGRAVLLSGEAGVGKSRLVHTLLSDVANEPHSLIEFRCSAHYANSPLYPIVRLLKVTLELRPDDPEAVRLEKLESFCARNGVSADEGLPLLASLLALPASARHPLPPMSPDRQKQRTLQTLLAVVLRMADEKPVLLVVEDLHWIDPTTTELLVLLVNQMATARVFALFTARLEFAPPWPNHSYVTSLALARFTRRQSEEMVERVARGVPLPAEIVKEIVAKTDGVPLFVEELTKMVLESDLIGHRGIDIEGRASAPVALAIPETLQDSLTARLDRLSTVKTVAQLGATLGREFSYGMLKAVSALDDDTLQRDLTRLVDAELLYQRGALPEATYLFKHALIQEAAYQSLLKTTRAQYHERIARVVVEQFATEAQARPEFVAMHYTEAGNLDTAIGWWQKAGQLAFRRASYAEAIAHYTRGLAVLDLLPPSEQRDQSEIGLQVDLGYALIPVKGWAAPMSAQVFTRAGELCSRLGDIPKQFRALWGLGAFHFVRGDQHQARQVADQCLGVARRANDVDAMIEAHYLSGIVACAIGAFDAAENDLRTCIRLYGDEERPLHRILYGQDAKASALGWLAMERCTRGHLDEAAACANQALALVRNSTQPFLLARGLAGVGFVDVLRREPQGSDSPLCAALALCVEQGFVYFNAVCSTFQGANLVFLGRPEEGIGLIRTNVALLRRLGSELLFTLILGHLADAHLSLKQIEEGLAAVDEGLACVDRNSERWGEAELRRLRGELLLQDGQREAARASFDLAMDVARRQQAKAYELRVACSLARLWSAEGRLTEAGNLVSEALRAWPEDLDSADLRDARAIVGFKQRDQTAHR